MNRKHLQSAIRVFAVLLLVAGSSASAQERRPTHLGGLINDYSPATVKGGPWELHGQWLMDLRPERDVADFSADLTMSGYGKTAEGAVDPTQAGQSPHVHHIRLKDLMITWDMIGCPVVSPANTVGFQVHGTVELMAANGGPAPFETVPPSSTLQVCVTGGNEVPYANVLLTFGAPATSHFGPQAIHGVVRIGSSPRP